MAKSKNNISGSSEILMILTVVILTCIFALILVRIYPYVQIHGMKALIDRIWYGSKYIR